MSTKAIAIGYAAQAHHAYSIALGPIMAFSKTLPTARAVATKEHEFVLAIGDSVARTTMTHQEYKTVSAVIERCLTPAFVEAMQFEARRGAEVEEDKVRSDFRDMCDDHQKMADAFHKFCDNMDLDFAWGKCSDAAQQTQGGSDV